MTTLPARESWIDYGKAVVAVSLIYVTAQRNIFANGFTDFSPWFHTLDSVLNSFLLPLCFFLSGVLYKKIRDRKSGGGLYGLLVGKLLYPFVIWTIILGLMKVVVSGYTGKSAFFLDIYFNLVSEPNSLFWFFPTLCLIYVLVNVLDRLRLLKAIPLFALGVVTYLVAPEISQSYPAKFIFEYFVFFVAGLFFAKNLTWIELHWPKVLPLSFAVAVFSQYLLHGLFSRESYSTDYWVLLVSLATTFTAVLLLLCVGRYRIPALSLLGRASIVLFLAQLVFTGGAREVLVKSLGVDHTMSLLVISVAAGVAGPLVIYLLSRKVAVFGLLYSLPDSIWAASWSGTIRKTWSVNRQFRYLTRSIVSFLVLFPFAVDLLAVNSLTAKPFRQETSQLQLSQDPEIVAEGERLASIFGCYKGCHGESLQGSIVYRAPFEGVSAAPNLTEAITKYSLSELDGIIRHGVWPSGAPVTGGMPSASYQALSDEQLSMILSFIATMPRQYNNIPRSSLGIKDKFALVTKELDLEADHILDHAALEKGSVESMVMAACGECHGAEFGGKRSLGSPPLIIAKAYSKEQFTKLLRTGEKLSGDQATLMGLVSNRRFGFFKDEEIEQIYGYLTDL